MGLICELLDLNNIILHSKIHFATGNYDNYEALREYENNHFKEWQEYQNKKNFSREYIIAFAYFKKDVWIFIGVYKIGICVFDTNSKCYKYDTILSENGKNYIGRLLINYKKSERQSYRYTESCINEFTLHSILETQTNTFDFPGYKNLDISFQYLKNIISNDNLAWKTALLSVKGVYLIKDNVTGKMYVGSATGEDNIWGRWGQYISTGHGNNKQLINLIKEKGIEYRLNFNFTILEVFDPSVEDNLIINRESYWKNNLMTRKFGYNSN